MQITSPLKWHGGKHYLAAKIVGLMPAHTHYVEPYAGGLSVLLHKDPEGVSEVVNDLDGDLHNFWTVLQCPVLFQEFRHACEATPFSEQVWALALDGQGEYTGRVAKAWAFFVAVRQSLAGRRDTFAPLSRNRTRRGMNEQAAAWLSAVGGLREVHTRLSRVVVLNRDALDVIRQQDGSATLFYLDPPYLPKTRTSPQVYAHEMTECEHDNLLGALRFVRGKFLLSGYRSDLYDSHAGRCGWKRHDFELPNNAAGGAGKRRMVECVWCNF